MHDWLLLKCPDCGNTFRAAAGTGAQRAACPLCGLEMIYDDGCGEADSESAGWRDAALSRAGQEPMGAAVAAPSQPQPQAAPAPQAVVPKAAAPKAARALQDSAPTAPAPQAARRARPPQSRGTAEAWDQHTPQPKSQAKALLGLGGMAALLAGAMIWMAVKKEQNPTDGASSAMVRELVASIPAPLAAEGTEERAQRSPQTGGAEDVAAAEGAQWRGAVSRDPERFMRGVQPVLEGFFGAESVAGRALWVADAARVLPLMERYYARAQHQGEAGRIGVSDLFAGSSLQLGRRGVQMLVALADYTNRDVVLVPEAGEWKVDWEAFVRYSSMEVDELKEQRPVEPQLFRGRVAMMGSQYHNFAFSDSERWASLMLHGEDAGNLLYAYVDKHKPGFASELHRALTKAPNGINVTLKVRYPENARVDNQVEVVDLVCVGFSELLGLDSGEKD